MAFNQTYFKYTLFIAVLSFNVGSGMYLMGGMVVFPKINNLTPIFWKSGDSSPLICQNGI